MIKQPKKNYVIIMFLCVCGLTAGCHGRVSPEVASEIIKIPIAIIGAIFTNPNELHYKVYSSDYRIAIQIDDTKCDVSDSEFAFIKKHIELIKPGMKRHDIERTLAIDTFRNRIVVTGMGEDLATFKNVYYFGNKSGIEMEFNEFTGALNDWPKLIGEHWTKIE